MKHKNRVKHDSNEPVLSSGIHHALMFWDCSNVSSAPSTALIKKLHVFDFDNTLFKSPGPNPNLYNDQSVGLLLNSDMLYRGGWWCNPLVLKNIGDGWDVEAGRKWEGFWNEDMVELLRLSNEDEDTVSIVMTGRQKKIFTSLIMDILEAKEIEYDGLVLKTGGFETTMDFKRQVITELLDTYTNVEEVVIYDDRKSQLNGFQTLLNSYIKTKRPSLIYNLIPVFTEPEYLDPKIERTLIEEIVENHNSAIENGDTSTVLKKVHLKKSFLYTGFFLSTESKAELIQYLVNNFQDHFTEEVLETYRFQVDFIPFTRSLPPRHVSTKLNSTQKVYWTVKELGYNNDSLAVMLKPVEPLDIEGFNYQLPPILPICSKGKSSLKPVEEFFKIDNWIPIEEGIQMECEFGPHVLFKITPDNSTLKKQKKQAQAQSQAVST